MPRPTGRTTPPTVFAEALIESEARCSTLEDPNRLGCLGSLLVSALLTLVLLLILGVV